MKILFIAPTFEGGIGGHAARVAEKLGEHGFEIKMMKIPSIPIKKIKNPIVFHVMKISTCCVLV